MTIPEATDRISASRRGMICGLVVKLKRERQPGRSTWWSPSTWRSGSAGCLAPSSIGFSSQENILSFYVGGSRLNFVNGHDL